MIKDLLNIENQEFINNNLNSDIASLLLNQTLNTSVDKKVLIEQIEAKKKCEKKLPTWFNTENIYYPNKLNIEQTSSEITAKYKSEIVNGDSIIDITGGFGVDCFYFSKRFNSVTHCEINKELSDIVKHNCNQLRINNIECISGSGTDILNSLNTAFDCIYIDPSRRSDIKGKVFQLKDCLPNVPEFLELFFKYSKTILIKTSPLLDFTIGINELKHVKTIHSLAVNNEVKELLWLLERDYNREIEIKTINIQKENEQVFSFNLNEELEAEAPLSKPLSYLYEPNSAILKAGAFNILAKKLNLFKLHKHSHLYTSENLIDFPGRSFKIENILPYNKKGFSKTKITKANVTTRNFPESVQNIRKKLKLKDGGKTYLFFTTSLNNEKQIIICSKPD